MPPTVTPIVNDPRTYVSYKGILEIHYGVENSETEWKVDLYDYVRSPGISVSSEQKKLHFPSKKSNGPRDFCCDPQWWIYLVEISVKKISPALRSYCK